VSGTFREPADPRRPRGSVSFCPSRLEAIAQRRSLPAINQIAIAAGVLLAVAVAAVLHLAVSSPASIFGIAAPLCGIGLGAFLAGKMAENAGLYHGALVGVGYVLVEVVGLAPAPLDPAGNGFAEGLSVIAGDALVLAVAAFAGWIAAPRARSLSSSGRGRDR